MDYNFCPTNHIFHRKHVGLDIDNPQDTHLLGLNNEDFVAMANDTVQDFGYVSDT